MNVADLRHGTSLPTRPSDDGRDRINELARLESRWRLLARVVERAALRIAVMAGRKGWRRPLAERFAEKVALSPTGCHLWLGQITHGYGYIWNEGGMRRAHRVSYELTHGERPPDHLVVMHTCDVRNCVNPDHLRLGTAYDNAQDCVAKGRHGNQWRKQLDGLGRADFTNRGGSDA